MISRVYLKDLISFDRVEIELEKGLVVLSGPSGAGKSLFINTILSTFGYGLFEAFLCEISIERPSNLIKEDYDLEDEIILKALKKEKVRYYLNGQNISKKILKEMFLPFVQYLSVRDKGGFESRDLLSLIDNDLISNNRAFKKLLKEYRKRFLNYKKKLQELEKIRENEAKILELIEFAEFEIEKIESIDPIIGEDEELLKVKQQLSRIDKVNDALESANGIFAFEEPVLEVYRLLEKDDSLFIETMNQLRVDFEEVESLSDELAEVDIESLLDRLEKISSLKKRYGSIEKAIEYAELKKRELVGYKNIEQDKSILDSFLTMEQMELRTLAGQITSARKERALELEKSLKKYLAELKLPPLKFIFSLTTLDLNGEDIVEVNLNGSTALTLSGGEFNRLRLALMVVALSGVKEGGVLILDEIDANVSGDESIAIANMIAELSEVYQIFAISHQPHLAAKANQHLLVSKLDGISRLTLLNKSGRVSEIARIIGGENPNDEALSFAKKLLN